MLLERDSGRIADTRSALQALTWEICEPVNVIAPAARSLAARHEDE